MFVSQSKGKRFATSKFLEQCVTNCSFLLDWVQVQKIKSPRLTLGLLRCVGTTSITTFDTLLLFNAKNKCMAVWVQTVSVTCVREKKSLLFCSVSHYTPALGKRGSIIDIVQFWHLRKQLLKDWLNFYLHSMLMTLFVKHRFLYKIWKS